METNIIESYHQGHSINAYKYFGAHLSSENGVDGVRFTVWAPHAKNVQVVGDFNDWDGSRNWLTKISDSVFSTFVPDIGRWTLYKYNIEGIDGVWTQKADPYAFYSELRPKQCSIVCELEDYVWNDNTWLKKRDKNYDKPMSIYEVYFASWKKHPDGRFYTYDDLAEYLIPYVIDKGFTHIEIMPLSEYPFDGSWGYQVSGYFSCTSRYGDPLGFMRFVDKCHAAGIGVIMDIVPVHFVKDEFGLRYFDGTPTYEYYDSSNANSEWGTLYFDLWKEEVRSFLMSSAAFWLEKYHIDGLRMDAVSNLIYWGGDRNRGVNEGALAFVRRMNYYLSINYPNCMLIAEDSSDFPKVTTSTYDLGLGFDYKWDLGWMNDTLAYFETDPIYRKYDHHKLTFSMAYFYSERFLLPLSHDEVVHGKKTILDKMWGDYDQKFAQAKTLYLYMFTHPGKKLNFMGNEIAMFREFDENKENDWFLLEYSRHDAFARFFEDMNKIYHYHTGLNTKDYDPSSFKWINADNATQSVYSYYREDENEVLVVVMNLTPTSYENYSIGVPYKGTYIELINTEKDIYEGCNMCNFTPLDTIDKESDGFENRLEISLAPFSGIVFHINKG